MSYTFYQASYLCDCVKALHHLCCCGGGSNLPAIMDNYIHHKVRKTPLFLSHCGLVKSKVHFQCFCFLFEVFIVEHPSISVQIGQCVYITKTGLWKEYNNLINAFVAYKLEGAIVLMIMLFFMIGNVDMQGKLH